MFNVSKKREIHPYFAIISSLLILFGGLIAVKTEIKYYYFCVMLIVLLLFGLYKTVGIAIIANVFFGAIYFGLNYLITKNIDSGIEGVLRISALCLAMVPGMNINVTSLTRALNKNHAPKIVSLGILITVRFLPLLKDEISKIRSAMTTRGAGHSLKTFYRSTLIPFCVRLVNISDSLSLSVETRSFGMVKDTTIYKDIKITFKDILFILINIACIITVILWRIYKWKL